MAYFANGSEGMVFDDECADCVFGDEPCPIALTQSIYNYEAVNNKLASGILNSLVEQDDEGRYIGCRMKKLIDRVLEKE